MAGVVLIVLDMDECSIQGAKKLQADLASHVKRRTVVLPHIAFYIIHASSLVQSCHLPK